MQLSSIATICCHCNVACQDTLRLASSHYDVATSPLRLPPELTTSKGSLNVYWFCCKYCVQCSWELKSYRDETGGNCDNSARSCHHHARGLSQQRSRLQNAAVGHPLGPSTVQERKGNYLVVKTTHLLMLWMIKQPLHCPAAGPAAKDEAMMRTTPLPGHGRAWPKRSCSQTSSSSSGDPTK